MNNSNDFSPNKEVNGSDKYNYLRSFDTARLQAMLQQESFVGSGNRLDVDLIQHILEFLDEREPIGEEPDVELSFKVFKEEIIPQLKNEKTRTESASFAPATVAPRRMTVRRKFATILIAASISILLGGTLVARAFGYNIWQFVIRWGKDTFQIGSEAQVTSGPSAVPFPQVSANNVKTDKYQTLDEALKAIGADILAPSWIPDGFELKSTVVSEGNETKSLSAVYKASESTIMYKAVVYTTNDVALSYEIDEASEESLVISGKTCYVVTNINQTGIIWIDKDVVYSIHSDTNKDNLIKIVRSIYEGEV